MDKLVFLSLCCVALCATSFAMNKAKGSKFGKKKHLELKPAQLDDYEEQWKDFDDSWYDEELEKLGIISEENNEPINLESKGDLNSPPKESADENKNEYGNLDEDWETDNEEQEKDSNDLVNDENINVEEAIADIKKEVEQEFEEMNTSEQKIDLKTNDDADVKVQKEIEQFLNENEFVIKEDDAFDDYQVEDNRSADDIKSENKAEIVIANQHNDDESMPLIDNKLDENIIEEIADSIEESESQMNLDDDANPIEAPPVDDINQEIIEETKNILEKVDDSNNSIDLELINGENKENILKDENNENSADQNKIEDDIQQDDNQDDSSFENSEESVVENNDTRQEAPNDISADDNTNLEDNLMQDYDEEEDDKVANIYEDLKDDLNNLLETMDKLAKNDDSLPEEEEEKVYEHGVSQENIADYEEEYNRPYREGNILQQREDYDESLQEVVKNGDDNVEQPISDEFEYDEEENMDDSIDSKPKPIPYINDALFDKNDDEEQSIREINSEVVIDSNNMIDNEPKSSKIADNPNHPVEPLSQEVLSSAELNDLMTQFALDHVEDLDVNSEDFGKNVAPVNIHLKLGETQVIESPGYPDPYPTNNIIDWRIDGLGEGMGIEMNITDLAINGIMGDYLLVKPGGVDETGQDGLIFSYMLRSERRYRFLDVDRMFVRFEAKPGMQLLANKGFKMSVRLVAPLAVEMEPIPEPEPVIELPPHRMLVFLGGLIPEQFRNVTEEFRMIVADMATMFVNRHGIDLGEVTTAEVTQITNVSTCNINWPGFELCTGVRFGVPLGIEGDEERLTADDLDDMWRTYVEADPFAARLRRLGVTEFAVPNDSTTLVVWLVIGFGVAISAGMLALALWRWSCFEDYTRMNAYSDTDSVLSDRKRDLDLYPTPHQTLPPLYDDDFIKYEARVDMGGFNNKGYSRASDLFDLDSDDDVTVLPSGKQNRSGIIQPQDIYPV